jgi:hypothetical protein
MALQVFLLLSPLLPAHRIPPSVQILPFITEYLHLIPNALRSSTLTTIYNCFLVYSLQVLCSAACLYRQLQRIHCCSILRGCLLQRLLLLLLLLLSAVTYRVISPAAQVLDV